MRKMRIKFFLNYKLRKSKKKFKKLHENGKKFFFLLSFIFLKKKKSIKYLYMHHLNISQAASNDKISVTAVITRNGGIPVPLRKAQSIFHHQSRIPFANNNQGNYHNPLHHNHHFVHHHLEVSHF